MLDDYNTRNFDDKDECAEMFYPKFEGEGFLTCFGRIGISNPGP